jgi:hypothetical protein
MEETTDRKQIAIRELTFTAYRIPDKRGYPKIVRSAPDREWMDVTTRGWANRCLPLRVANQAGWFILNDVDFEVTWDGSVKLEGLKLRFKNGESKLASSMFGFGILTWAIPYIFRTAPGYNLFVRGPTNEFKDGAIGLDAIVEADWLPYPFTMNWKITRPRRKVEFKKDEPICMIMPIKRGDAESFEPDIRNLVGEPDLHASYAAWHEQRLAKVAATQGLQRKSNEGPKQGFYTRGESVLGERASEHQTKLHLKDFVEKEPAIIVPPQEDMPSIERKLSLISRLFRR